MPPLVNGHTHAAMTLFRGSGGDLPLMPWLEEQIWPVEAKLDDEDVYWGARLACAEMIRTGTTRFWDMYWHPEATARAVADAGIRATIGAPLFDARRHAPRSCARPRTAASTSSPASGRRSPPPSPRTRSTPSASRVAALDRRAQRRARAAGADPPLRDRGRGPGLPRRARRAARRLPRPARAADRAHGARPRRLARPRRAGAGRRARRHRRHQPGGEHEARGRRRLPLPRGARRGRRASASAPTAPAPTTRSTCSPT